jgi:hypothetical protein
MRRDREVPDSTDPDAHDINESLLTSMIETLLQNADTPPTDIKGVSETFITDLVRIPKKSLKPDMDCPICSEPFLDDPYPLIVRLPCHKDHLFDLECIRPWLLLHGTCPLDRKDFGKAERERAEKRRQELEKARKEEADDEEEEEEEGEWDGLYG